MINFETGEIRKVTKILAPTAEFNEVLSFFYDETNNIRKFYVREMDFNSSFTANFVLGGLVHEGEAPDVTSLIDSLKLQKTTKEVKFKHIAKGGFLDCLKSEKLKFFLKFIKNSNLYVHYSSLNILYWAIVDIVDSAIANSEASQKLGPQFSNHLKNDLYKLSRLEIDSVINVFYKFKYPNIKKENIHSFINALTSIFEGYINTAEFHFGLESLKQVLTEVKKTNSLPFIMEEDDGVLLKDLSMFYLRPIYLFKHSTHVFDNEDSIAEILNTYNVLDESVEIQNYSFVDSQDHQLIQLSDVFVGLMGKLAVYLNTTSRESIDNDFCSLSVIQERNIDLLIDLIDKSISKNIGFIHSIDSYEEMSKMDVIRKKRNKTNA